MRWGWQLMVTIGEAYEVVSAALWLVLGGE
jgi:hypothetical protein